LRERVLRARMRERRTQRVDVRRRIALSR